MEFLLNLPALLKVGLAFLFILLVHRFKLHLSACLFLGAMALGLMMGLGPGRIILVMAEGVTHPRAVSLGLIVAAILVLSRLMADSGQLERIVTSFTRLARNVKVAGVVMPALIGLLPMPGGALFSAPMVDTACRGSGLKPEVKTAINYWFRHIWEYWWPLYPAVVLAVSLLNVEAWRFMLIQFPLTVVSVGAGLLFMMRGIPAESSVAEENHESIRDRWSDFRREVRPITLIVLAIPAVKIIEAITGVKLPNLTAVFTGLALCLTYVIIKNHVGAKQAASAVMNKSLAAMLILVAGIMAFQSVLVESRAVAGIQTEMDYYGIPTIIIILIMPFLTGFITGIGIGFVGASFPLIVPLMADMQGLDFLAHASLAYAFGYVGMMLSPVHLCFLLTKDYFSASLIKSYRYLIGPLAIVTLYALVFFGLTRLIGNW